MLSTKLMIFTGNANRLFAEKVAGYLNLELGKAEVSCFADGEVSVSILDNVRGADVFILQPTCFPTNDNLMELLVLTDALKRSSAGRITAAMPYFGYARQDRRPRSARVPISAKLVANMLMSAGVNRVLTVDLHADQIQGFFDIPVDNIYASPVLLQDIKSKFSNNYDELMIVSPDTGGVARARAFAKALGTDIAIIDKRRPKANEAEVMNVVGQVVDRHCLIVDDIIDTATTLIKAASTLKAQGAKSVYAYASHAVLSGDATAKIEQSPLTEVVITDSIPLRPTNIVCTKLRIVSLTELFAAAIERISNESSLSYLLSD